MIGGRVNTKQKIKELLLKYENDLNECNEQLTTDFSEYRSDPSNLDLRDSVRMLQGQIGVYECIIEQLRRILK